ncbi:MAG: hypothetical protein MZV64_63500 [Ignavibacteriales bacterium]|nr:hypothetical protein [Ignavibacteriales bacterium]
MRCTMNTIEIRTRCAGGVRRPDGRDRPAGGGFGDRPGPLRRHRAPHHGRHHRQRERRPRRPGRPGRGPAADRARRPPLRARGGQLAGPRQGRARRLVGDARRRGRAAPARDVAGGLLLRVRRPAHAPGLGPVRRRIRGT